MSDADPTPPGGVDPLEEQRDFLLRSLDDLDAEYEAGDVEEEDYRRLRDDYTARAAAVLRAMEEERPREQGRSSRPASARSWLRPAALVTVVLLLAVGAGLAVARSSGTREAGEQVSGDIRLTNRDRLLQALERVNAGEPVEALELYDEVLETEPDNPEALTYRGWTLALSGLLEEGLVWLDRAVQADPGYPDARALRAVVLANGLQRPEAALEDLEALDRDALPPDILPLVDGLRQRLLEETGADTGPDLPASTVP